VLLRGDTELVVGVVPDLLHVIPVGDDSVLDRVLEGENTSLRLSLISDVRVLLSHTDHHSLMTGSSHDRRKHSAGSVISRKTGLKKELNATNIHELFNFKNHFTHRAENQYKNKTNEPYLVHSGSIVNNKGGNLLVTHCYSFPERTNYDILANEICYLQYVFRRMKFLILW